MKKAVAMVLVVVMMLAFGATAFAAQEPRTTVNCCTSFGDSLNIPIPWCIHLNGSKKYPESNRFPRNRAGAKRADRTSWVRSAHFSCKLRHSVQ